MLPPLLVDADPWLRKFRLPHWALGQIRKLKLGEVMTIVAFSAPTKHGRNGEVLVTITRNRGSYRLETTWLANLKGKQQKSGHIWWWVDFKLAPGRKLELIQEVAQNGRDSRLEGLHYAALVLRRGALLARAARRDGEMDAARAMDPGWFMWHDDLDGRALEWLVKLGEPRAV